MTEIVIKFSQGRLIIHPLLPILKVYQKIMKIGC